jgi:hypothetical protein
MSGHLPNGSSSSVGSQRVWAFPARTTKNLRRADSACADNACADNALTAGKCPLILAAVMGTTRQAGEMSSGAWVEGRKGPPTRGGRFA